MAAPKLYPAGTVFSCKHCSFRYTIVHPVWEVTHKCGTKRGVKAAPQTEGEAT